jgi:hypothetical protein
VFPSQELVVVRTGQDPGLVNFAGGTTWEEELYTRVLASITDERVEAPGPEAPAQPDRADNDYGFQTALREPDQYGRGVVQDPLPPAGPQRARASRVDLLVRASAAPAGSSCASPARRGPRARARASRRSSARARRSATRSRRARRASCASR